MLYVMARDQRIRDNHALLSAQAKALELKLPLVVQFNLLPSSGVRAREHFEFMLTGLKEVIKDLKAHNIGVYLTKGKASQQITAAIEALKPACVYFDFSPLSGPRQMVKKVAAAVSVPCTVVDTHNIIPVWIVSNKREFAAHTLRGKIHKQLQNFLVEPPVLQKHPHRAAGLPNKLQLSDFSKAIPKIPACGISIQRRAGEAAAHRHLKQFLQRNLKDYALLRNDIAQDKQSGLSPYLHFGQMSSLRVALETLYHTDATPLLFTENRMAKAREQPNEVDGMNALFEEMIVRKELADNFCFYSPDYLSVAAADQWAKQTLHAHQSDPREHHYAGKQLEAAQTHDPAWNAAQQQLLQTGNIHGYMRMYWAKKLLEWTATPQEAIDVALYLNDHYSIDGGDPNGYVGILWSIIGIHDRPWTERPIFGKIRYMNYGGLKRKFDVEAYIKGWNTKPG